jgi:sialidase-1
MIRKQVLFEARTGGYHTCRIPGLLVARDNTVLVTAEARPGTGGDYDYNDVLLRRSTDGGLTFSPPVRIVDHRAYGEGPVSNFVMISDQRDGVVHALFCHDYARVFAMASRDSGRTFSDPVEITRVLELLRSVYPWRVVATGPGHGLQLRQGRMIVPVWMADSGGAAIGSKHRVHHPSAVSLIYSDDHGHSWQAGPVICKRGDRIDGHELNDPSETIAVELSDGRVMFNMRNDTDVHRRLVAVSPDGVRDWRVLGFDPALLDPICMASMLRYDWPAVGSGPAGRILFANPDNLENLMTPQQRFRDRKRLTVKGSLDDGRTWPVSRVIESGPAGYSDLGRLADGTILCLYECGQVERMFDDRYVMLASFDPDWLTGAPGKPS